MRCCCVIGCDRQAIAKSLCGMHYQRAKVNGDPNIKRSLRGEPLNRRFWSRVRITPGCWDWLGPVTADGYGRLFGVDKEARAHRLSFEMHVGPIPEGLFVLHKCDNPPCCNPDHLFLGTTLDNARDCIAKGRSNVAARSGTNHWMRNRPDLIARGSRMGRSHLTEAMVAEIRARFVAGGVTQRDLARQFQVGHKNLNLIVKGKTWKHVPQPKGNT